MTARLSANDARDILEIIDDLSRVPTSADLLHESLHHLVRIIPSVNASFNWFSQGRVDYVVHPPIPFEETPRLERVMLRNWRQNPLVEHFLASADTRALRWRDLADEAQWRRSPLYREFYLPLGIEDQLGLRLPSPPGVAAALVVNGDRPFDDRDASVLSRLGRHVITQLRTLADRDVMRDALDGLGWSALLIDDDGRVVGDRSASLAHLVGQDDRLATQVRAVVLESADPGSQNGNHVVRNPEGSLSTIFVRNALPPHSLFVNVAENGRDAGSLSALAELGLSRREIEVAILMLDGTSNAVIARQLGIALGTVKKHLERIFRTLGVPNRTAAANAVSRRVGLTAVARELGRSSSPRPGADHEG